MDHRKRAEEILLGALDADYLEERSATEQVVDMLAALTHATLALRDSREINVYAGASEVAK